MNGRNRKKPCHCGSGQKYKKCHLLIEQHLESGQVKKLEIHELQKIFNETLYKEICVASDLNTSKQCTAKIINAHTLTKSLSLEKIATNGHVYAFKNKDLFSFFKGNGVITLKKIGIRTASTFKGFCSYHDDYLFSSIEKENFELSEKQVLALFYRSFALEYYKKKSIVDNARKSFEPLLKNFNLYNIDHGSKTLIANLKRAKLDFEDMIRINEEIKRFWNIKNKTNIQTYALKVANGIPFVCTGLFAIYKDIKGNIIQDIYDYDLPNLEYMSLNIFYSKDGAGWLVLNWLKEKNSINELFVEQLKEFSIEEQINILGNLMILYTENAYFSVDYVDNMDVHKKENIEKTFNNTLRGIFDSLTKDSFEIKIEKAEVKF